MSFLTSKTQNLQHSGPTIEVVIVPPQAVIDQLKKDGKYTPSQRAIALIDTGTSSTCISTSIVEQLGLFPFDAQTIHTAAGETEQLLYDAGVVLPVSRPNVISVQSPCADLTGQPFQVLIGRDVLSKCTLFYNGSDNSFTLHF